MDLHLGGTISKSSALAPHRATSANHAAADSPRPEAAETLEIMVRRHLLKVAALGIAGGAL
eukprot:6049990-Heterocapsa_arctica.AAC.1